MLASRKQPWCLGAGDQHRVDVHTLAAVGSSLMGGLVSLAAYGIVIWAMQSVTMGAVSALRETSVVLAALIGRIFLRETVSRKRWGACLIVAAGAILQGL